MPPLHLGVILPNYGATLDPERLAAAALAAEELSFDSGWNGFVVNLDHESPGLEERMNHFAAEVAPLLPSRD